MNILHLIHYAGSGGTEKYVLTLIRRQIAAGHTCTLVYGIEGPLVGDAAAAGAEVLQMPMRHILDLKAARTLRGISRTREISVIHAHYPRENCIAILAKRMGLSAKVITTAHLVFACDAKWRVINRLFSPRNHAVLCVCEAQIDQLTKNGIRPDRLRVIHNGVPFDRVADPARLRREIRAEFGIPEDAFVVTTLTRYEPVKGTDMLLETARLVQKRLPEARFLIAGQGSEFESARETIKRYGMEGFFLQAGFRRDTDAILCAGDVSINTSRSEALSFAITEAMSLSLPVVITKVGGNPEIVPTEADGGYLVPFGDAAAMAERLCRLSEDPALRARMGAAAAERVRREFSEEVMYENIMKAYES